MGRPRLLTEALDYHRGDVEDRVTELFLVTLDAHRDFCRRLLAELGVEADDLSLDMQSQGPEARPKLVDLTIRCRDGDSEVAVVYFEHKYTPLGAPRKHWFSHTQANEQREVLETKETAPKRVLLGIASEATTNIWGYDWLKTWAWVTELAHEVGGGDGWPEQALLPDAPASARILLEFVRYMKGDAVGPLIDEDIRALGRRKLAADRMTKLLGYAAKVIDQGTTGEVHRTDWEAPSGAPIAYVLLDAQPGSWLEGVAGGYRYLFITDYGWNESGSSGEPVVYAGVGWEAEGSMCTVLTQSAWMEQVKGSDERFELLGDVYGVYLVQEEPLMPLIEAHEMLSDQAEAVGHWAEQVITAVDVLPAPPPPPAGAQAS
jgi:hypothetical protein